MGTDLTLSQWWVGGPAGKLYELDTIVEQIERPLSRAPFIFRKAGQSPFVRELVIPFRGGGFVVLHEIEGGEPVNMLAVRHQLEDDYH